MVLDLDPQVRYTQEFKALAAETQAYIVIGYVVEDEHGFRNEATVLSPSGEYLGRYGKNHPMITTGEKRMVGAGKYPVFETSLAKIGILICFDASFTDSARQLGRQGVQLIANPSMFGPSIAHLTHTMVVFRAIENHSAIVMADVAYNSAIVDPFGQPLKSTHTKEGEQALLVTEVPLWNGKTLYAKFGDWLGWFSLIGGVVFIFSMPLKLKK